MSPQLETRHLRLVAAIAQHGGVSAAAKHLFLTQSAVSHQLRDVETIVGTRLFSRRHNRMVPTPAGEKLLASAQRMLAELARVENDLRSTGAGQETILRITTECYTCYHWLPCILQRFQQAHPRVSLQIDVEDTREPIPALLAGKIDVAILLSDVNVPGVLLKRLWNDEVMIVCSRDHPFASRPYVRPADLANETVLVYPPRQESWLLRELLSDEGVAPRSVKEVPLTEAIMELAAAGMGVGFLARWAIGPRIRNHNLAARRFTRNGYRRSWSVATRAGTQPQYVADLVALIEAHAGPAMHDLESTAQPASAAMSAAATSPDRNGESAGTSWK